jgi:hypothetical protein
MVSVKIAGVSLEEVLKEISSQSGVRLVLEGSRQEEISAEFDSVPLEEALRRLIKENFLLLYGAEGQLVEARVLGVESPFPSPPMVRESEQRIVSEESESFESLVVDLEGGDSERRGRAVLLLGESKDDRALEPAIGALERDEDADVRRRAVWALGDLGGERAKAALAEAVFGDRDESVRNMAVEALAQVGGMEAIEPLTQALREDPDSFVRYKALVSLAEMAGDVAQGAIRQALNDPDELIWAKAEEMLEMR